MAFFITVLRALAACLITNSHYTGIYPSDIIANGGLVGDVLFFAVSGYCLYNVKLPFFKWYGKRLWRVYLPVVLGTLILLLLGGYSFSEMTWFEWFIYPTYYHFVASIVFLYIPFYFLMKFDISRNHIVRVMGIIAAIALVVYLTVYDKSYYHIDTVREPFIRFLFVESMLLGAYFRQNDEKLRNSFSIRHILFCVVSFVLYFASKLVFSRFDQVSVLQIANQILIFVLLYYIFRLFIGIDKFLEKIPDAIKKLVTFVANMTLEIYIVQYIIIAVLRPYFGFPINWIVITASIACASIALHMLCKYIYKFFDFVVLRAKKSRVKEEAK